MQEEVSSPTIVTVNVLPSNESQEHGSSEHNPELVSTIASEVSGSGGGSSELVEQGSNSETATRPSGSLQFGDANEPNDNATTEIASDAVEIARIDADRDITIAAIEAETIRDASLGNVELEELEECKNRIANLELEIEAMRDDLNSSTQTPVLAEEIIPKEITEELETPTEPNSTEEFTADPINEIETAASNVNEDVEADMNRIPGRRFIPI